MAVPTTMTDLSTTAASNSPAGADTVTTTTGPDEFLRALSAIVRREQAKGANVASAATVDLGAIADGSFVHITGTTTITSFGTVAAGITRVLVFDGALTLTHNATSLILIGGANQTTAAGSVAVMVSEGSGNWRQMAWFPAAGYASLGANTFTGTQTVQAAATQDAVKLAGRAGGTSSYAVTLTPATLTGNKTATFPDKSGTVAMTSDVPFAVQDFRLTLTSSLPVTTADVTAAGTIYAAPKTGNLIGLYSGGAWVVRQSAEFSLALSGLTSGKPYDVFCYDNSGTPTLEFLVWTNDTTRATALAYQDGVLVKSGDATRRYLGSFYTTGTTTTEDSASKRFLWNYYHRVRRYLTRSDVGSWTYTTAAYRQANGSSSNQVEFVCGVAEDALAANVVTVVAGTSLSVFVAAGIGLDSTTTNSAQLNGNVDIHVSGSKLNCVASYRAVPSAGRHYLTWLEYGGTGVTFFGTTSVAQSGIQAEIFA